MYINSCRGGGVSGSGRLGRKQKKSWFSSQNALDVYAQYLALDTDHNGMLSKKVRMYVNFPLLF